jgi:nicotinamide-nucleotide amidase
MWMKRNTVLFRCRVPYEMKWLKTKSFKGCERIRTAVHYPQNNSTYGQGESLISERIEAWENSLPQF